MVGSETQSSSWQAASGQHRTRQGSTWRDVAPAGGRLSPEPQRPVQLTSERHCRHVQTGSIATALRNSGLQPEATAGGLSVPPAAAGKDAESQSEAAACGQPEAQTEAVPGSAQAEPMASLPPMGASSKRAAPEDAAETCHPKRPRTQKHKASSSRPEQTSCPQNDAPLPGQATTQSPAEQGTTAGGHSLMQAEPAASLPGREWPDGLDHTQAEQGGSVGHSSPAQAELAPSLSGREQAGLHREPSGASEPGTPRDAQHTAVEHFHTPPDTCAPSAGCSAASRSCPQLDVFLTAHSQDSCPLPGAASGAGGCEEATSSLQTPAHAAGDGKAAERQGSGAGAGCSASGGAMGGGWGAHQQLNGPECVPDSGDAPPTRTLVCLSRALVLQPYRQPLCINVQYGRQQSETAAGCGMVAMESLSLQIPSFAQMWHLGPNNLNCSLPDGRQQQQQRQWCRARHRRSTAGFGCQPQLSAATAGQRSCQGHFVRNTEGPCGSPCWQGPTGRQQG